MLAFEPLQAHVAALRWAAIASPGLTGLEFLGIFSLFSSITVIGVEPLIVMSGLLFCTVAWARPFALPTWRSPGGSLVYWTTRRLIDGTPAAKGNPPRFAARIDRVVASMREGYQQNGKRYMFSLRPLPLFAFRLIHVGSAILGIAYLEFLWETIIGTIPITLLFASFGAGLGAWLDHGGVLSSALLTSPAITAPLLTATGVWLLVTLLQVWTTRQSVNLGVEGPQYTRALADQRKVPA